MRILITKIILLISICGYSQRNDIRFDHITTKDGLPNSIVFTIYQDHLGFMWFGTNNGLARYDGYHFKTYQPSSEGTKTISHKNVTSIFDDKEKNLWLVLQNNGVNRFNPLTGCFNHYIYNPTNPTSISGSEIRTYLCDSKNNIWFGTSNGLNCFDKQIEGFEKYFNTPDTTNSLSDNYINNIIEDKKGLIWIASNSGVDFLNRENNKIYRLASVAKNGYLLKNTKVLKLSVDRNNRIWICCYSKGLWIYDPATNLLTSYLSKSSSDNLPSPFLYTIVTNSLGDMYVFSNVPQNNMYVFKQSTGKFSKYELFDSKYRLSYIDFTEDKNHNLWIGSFMSLIKFDYKKSEIQTFNNDQLNSNSIAANRIYSVFADRNNILWVGVYKEGIDKVDLKKNRFTYYTQSLSQKNGALPENNVTPIFQDSKKNYWIGTQEKGVVCFDQSWKKKHTYTTDVNDRSKLFFDSPYCFCEDKHGNIWVGSWSGQIDIINPNNHNIHRVNYTETGNDKFEGWNVRNITSDKQGNIWIVTSNMGLVEYQLDSGKFIYHSLLYDPNYRASGFYRTIFIDSQNKIWLGSQSGGLQLYDKQSYTFSSYRHQPNDSTTISSNTIYCFYQQNDSIYWLGTALGINRFNQKTKKFTHYSTRNGLCNNTIYSLLPDPNGNLWCSTDNGLTKFNIQDKSFTNFFESDGLLTNEFISNSYYKAPNGELFFGSSKGVVSFFPSNFKSISHASKPILTDFKLFNQSVNIGDTILGSIILKNDFTQTNKLELSYKHDIFTIEFSALHYSTPDKIKYEYKLENYNNQWITTDWQHRSATYTNLPAGHYIFHLRSTNDEGSWCSPNDEVKLEITITPPFWKTRWFSALLIVCVIILLFRIVKTRTKKLQEQKNILEKTVKNRTLELEEANTYLEEKQEEINMQKEEMQSQRDSLLEANSTLQEQQQKILQQNEELDKHRHQLEHLVDVRTNELEKAKDKAEESDRLKSAFLANMSHEIRTPMNAIVGFSSLLLDETITKEEIKQFTSLIMSNSDSLMILINDILDISKIQAQQLIIHPKTIKIFDVLDDVYETFLIQAQPKELVLKKETNSFSPNLTCHTDPFRLKQILINLIGNAIKFTDKGYIEFGISNQTSDFLTFYIKDTGIGIPENIGNSIFERFLKVDPNKDNLYGGTGLGLAISKSLVEILGGTIWYESVFKIGTTFYFTLPCTHSANSYITENKHITTERVEIPDLSDKTILIADDEDTNYLVLSAMIAKTKATVLWAKNGLEAFEATRNHKKIDLVLMDVKMPIMDGISATKLIKQHHPELLIVAQTAFAQEEEKHEFSNMGFNDYITKPIIVNELMTVLGRLLA